MKDKPENTANQEVNQELFNLAAELVKRDIIAPIEYSDDDHKKHCDILMKWKAGKYDEPEKEIMSNDTTKTPKAQYQKRINGLRQAMKAKIDAKKAMKASLKPPEPRYDKVYYDGIGVIEGAQDGQFNGQRLEIGKENAKHQAWLKTRETSTNGGDKVWHETAMAQADDKTVDKYTDLELRLEKVWQINEELRAEKHVLEKINSLQTKYDNMVGENNCLKQEIQDLKNKMYGEKCKC